jgi:hypothetical protein
MQTSIAQNLTKAIKGMALVAPRQCRPLQLRSLPQILSLTITAGAGTDNVALTLTDVKTGFVYPVLTVTGNANEATLGAAIRAAWAASPKHNSLFSVAATQESSGSDLILAFTARNPNIEYTLSRVGGPDGVAATSTATETQAEGGSGLAFGQLVAKGSGDDEFQVMSATTTVRDIAGALVRTDANHFQDIPPGAADLCPRGVHMPIAEEVEMWVQPIEAVTPASRPHVCVEAATGRVVGDWGDTPAGTAQVLTITPAANLNIYGFAYSYRDASGVVHQRTVIYQPTDATNTAAEANAGLEDAAAQDAPTGITVSAAAGATMTLTAAVGTEIFGVNTQVWGLDAEVTSVTASLSSADVDMLDVSSIAKYTSSGAAGELVKVKIRLAV